MNIVLLGPPGAGKGTQSFLIKKVYGVEPISTGELVRQEIKNQTKIGREIKSLVDAGHFPEDEVIMDLAAKAIQECSGDFVCDGFPRTLRQAEMLDALLRKAHKKIDAVIQIEVDRDILVQRLTGRIICETCGAISNSHRSQSGESAPCPECGGKSFIRREDDNAASIQRRLAVYEAQTLPLVAYYSDRRIVTKVDGMKSAEDVFDQIRTIFDQKSDPREEAF